jgi:hypothetical protein
MTAEQFLEAASLNPGAWSTGETSGDWDSATISIPFA